MSTSPHYSDYVQNLGAHSSPMTPQQFQQHHPWMSTNQAEAASKASGSK